MLIIKAGKCSKLEAGKCSELEAGKCSELEDGKCSELEDGKCSELRYLHEIERTMMLCFSRKEEDDMDELILRKHEYTIRAKQVLKRTAQDVIELSQIAHEYHEAFGYQEYIRWIKEDLQISENSLGVISLMYLKLWI